MVDVVPRFKDSMRPWSCPKSDPACTGTAPCPSCRGRRNRTQGLRKQRAARKALGVPPSRFHGEQGNEENWRWKFRTEVKSGKQVGPMVTRYLLAESQANSNKAEGDARPFAFVAMPAGMSDGFICLRLSTWRREIAPYLED